MFFWVQRRTNCRVGKIVLDGAKEYIKGTKELGADKIEVSVTASYTAEEKVRAERMNGKIKNAIQTTLLQSGALRICRQNVCTLSAMDAIALFEWGTRGHHSSCLLV